MKLSRRVRVLATIAVATTGALTASNTTASAQTADTESTVFPTQSMTASADFAPADWTASIPGLYLAGQAVWGIPTTLPNGKVFQPVVSRIFRGGTYFAIFADDKGRYYGISEDDGTLWKIHDYYDSHTWELYSFSDEGQDVRDQTPWIIQAIAWLIIHLPQIIAVIVIALAFLMALFVFWVFGPGNKARGGPRNQLSEGFLQGGGGIGQMWDTDPRYRSQLSQLPGEVDALMNMGEITFNP